MVSLGIEKIRGRRKVLLVYGLRLYYHPKRPAPEYSHLDTTSTQDTALSHMSNGDEV
jgi:hypothetical protein